MIKRIAEVEGGGVKKYGGPGGGWNTL